MNKQFGIIYKVTNIINNKSYIGQTIQSLKERKRQHYKFAKKRCNYKFSNALNKYESNNFLWEILENNIPIDNLNDKEVYYINLYDSFNKGYNSTPGKYNRFIRKCSKINQETILELYNIKTKVILKISRCDFMKNLCKNTSSGAYRMLNNQLLRYNEWILYENYNKYLEFMKENNKKSSDRFSDKTIYTIINDNTKEKFMGFRKDFIKKINIPASCMHNLIKNYEIKTYKYWKIVEIQKN